jgi:hypothetical protein
VEIEESHSAVFIAVQNDLLDISMPEISRGIATTYCGKVGLREKGMNRSEAGVNYSYLNR